MSHYSFRNKHLVLFPNGKLMLLCEVSDSCIRNWNNKRVWDKCLIHPKDSLYYTKETLKAEQDKYVEHQLQWLRDFHRDEVEKGYAREYVEPTLESHDYGGNVYPGGSRIKNGKSFYGYRPERAEDFFARWDAPKSINLSTTDKDFNTTWKETYNIQRADLDDIYAEVQKAHGKVWIGIN